MNLGDRRVVRWCLENALLIWIRVGQGPTALAIGASGGCLDIFLSSISSLFFLSLSEKITRYRMKYFLKGPLNPKQPTNQISEFKNVIFKAICLLSAQVHLNNSYILKIIYI